MPQPADMDVDTAVERGCSAATGKIEKLIAGQDLSRPFYQRE